MAGLAAVSPIAREKGGEGGVEVAEKGGRKWGGVKEGGREGTGRWQRKDGGMGVLPRSCS